MANRYFINGGVNDNWSTDGNWSATSGGGASGVKPTASDTVYLDANSPVCDIDSAAVAGTINFTNYAQTVTFNANLTVSGNVTLEGTGASYVAGVGSLIIGATAIIVSDGLSAFPIPLNFGGGYTGGEILLTVTGDLVLTGGLI